MRDQERLMKIKTTGLRKVGKVILWILVCFLLVKGVIGILDNKSQDKMLQSINDYTTAAEQREAARAGAASFAEKFVYAYYSFDGSSNSDYSDRVQKYLANALAFQKPVGSGIATQVLSAKAFKITFSEKSKMDVDVLAKVRYTGDNASGSAISDKDLNLRVPVAYKDGKYAVDAMPMLIPEDEAANISRSEGNITGSEVDQKEEREIKQVLESFFKTYYEGTDQEVAYYVSDHSKIKHSLQGTFTFEGVKRIEAYLLPDSEKYVVDAVISINDNGQGIEQEMYLYLTKGENKYFIEEISTRVK